MHPSCLSDIDTSSYFINCLVVIYMALSNDRFMEFESREDAYYQLLDTLEKKDGSVMLGIYGSPGIGKTTLVEQVCKRALELQLFDQVAIVNASQIVDDRALRLKIGSCLDVTFPDEEEDEASALAAKWAYGANILIVFEDVEHKMSLEDVGIPFGDNKWCDAEVEDDIRTAPGVDRRLKGCTVLITSETRDVCYVNNCNELIEIERLEKGEAWDLFSDIVGSRTIDSLEEKDLARTVCESCQGLPLEIAAVGTALCDKGEDELRDAIAQMMFHGKVPLAVAFNALPKDEKLCLLSCSLYDGVGEAMIPINFLFRTVMGLGMFEGLETLADARDKLDSMLVILKSSLLLLEGTYNHVKMHSKVRDVAREVAAEDLEYAFHFEARKSNWPRIKDVFGNINNESSDVKLLSLSFDTDDVFEYPDDVDFPNLHTLIINFSNKSGKIKHNFFNAFPNLRHLMISSSPALPSSLGNLEANLQMLGISNSNLNDISMITRMKNLEMLSFDGVNFNTPPINLKDMEHLRILHFTNCHGVALLQHSMSSLLSLEELILTNSFQILDEEAETECPIYPELTKLIRLTNLQIYQSDTSSFPEEDIWQSLKRYTVSLGENFQQGELVSSSKSLKFCYGSLEDDGVKNLVHRSQVLVLQGVLSGLQECFRIKSGVEFEEITRLKVIACYKVKYLGKISHWRLNKVALQSFSKLSVLDMSLGTEFEYIFSTSIARGLQQLQELRIFECVNLEEIVRDEGDEDRKTIIAFPKLRYIDFYSMPKVRSFRSAVPFAIDEGDQYLFDEMVQFPALESIKIYNMSGLHGVFAGKVEFPGLKILDIYDLENLREIWKMDIDISTSFAQLEILKVRNCPQLEKLIASSMLQSLKYLREPKIENCELLFEMLPKGEEPSSE